MGEAQPYNYDSQSSSSTPTKQGIPQNTAAVLSHLTRLLPVWDSEKSGWSKAFWVAKAELNPGVEYVINNKEEETSRAHDFDIEYSWSQTLQ